MALYTLFSSKARVKVLALLLSHPSERFYQREIAQRTGLPIQAVQRELAKMTGIGLVGRISEGNRTYYTINKAYYIFKELKSIFHKSLGVGEALRDALKEEQRLQFAFIFGSVARGTERPDSDIDLLVVGDVTAKQLNDLLFPVSQRMGREINQHLYSRSDYLKKLKSGNHFALRVAKGPKLFLTGTADEFKQFIKVGKTKTA